MEASSKQLNNAVVAAENIQGYENQQNNNTNSLKTQIEAQRNYNEEYKNNIAQREQISSLKKEAIVHKTITHSDEKTQEQKELEEKGKDLQTSLKSQQNEEISLEEESQSWIDTANLDNDLSYISYTDSKERVNYSIPKKITAVGYHFTGCCIYVFDHGRGKRCMKRGEDHLDGETKTVQEAQVNVITANNSAISARTDAESAIENANESENISAEMQSQVKRTETQVNNIISEQKEREQNQEQFV